jgi:hypothetical protein
LDSEKFFQKLEQDGMLVDSIHSLGWGFWPQDGGGYFDEYTLRLLADEIERRNKPFWDNYEEYCKNLPLDLPKEEIVEDCDFGEFK